MVPVSNTMHKLQPKKPFSNFFWCVMRTNKALLFAILSVKLYVKMQHRPGTRQQLSSQNKHWRLMTLR